MCRYFLFGLLIAGLAGPAVGQNWIVNGDFQNGQSDWQLVRRTASYTTYQVTHFDVNGNDDSNKAFRGLFYGHVRPGPYEIVIDSKAFFAGRGSYPFTVDLCWWKSSQSVITPASQNRVDFLFMDQQSRVVTSLTQPVPSAAAQTIRITMRGDVVIPGNGNYTLRVFMRHNFNEVVNIWLDDIALGQHGATISGTGSAKIGRTAVHLLRSPVAPCRPYQVLSGLSGSTPGIPLCNGRRIQLNPDPMFMLSIIGLPGIFVNYVGLLDCQAGNGVAMINIPPLPGLAGMKLYTAFVTVDPLAPCGLRSISNTYAFTIQR